MSKTGKKRESARQWFAALALMAVLSPNFVQADVTNEIFSLTADTANSSTAYYGSALANVLTDPFAYNPLIPTAAWPVRTWSSSAGFHGNESDGSDVILSFTLDTPFTNTISTVEIFLDLWGRDANQNRDDNFDVFLYNGDYSTPVATLTGQGIPASTYVRCSFGSLALGAVFDRIQIVGHNSSGQTNNPFTLMEIRLVALTPYTWTGAANDGVWTNAVNWLSGIIPVDNRPGTGFDAGLTVLRFDPIVFAGYNMPTLDMPGLGGTVSLGDTPTLRLRSGGDLSFNNVSRERGLWTDSFSGLSTLFEVGDGIGGGSNDVSLTISGTTGTLNRHKDGIHNFLVNSDGTLTFNSNVDFSYRAGRTSTFTINGGSVIVNGSTFDLDDLDGNFVEFISTNGVFTANYGGDFPNTFSIEQRLGLDFINNSGYDDWHFIVDDHRNGSFSIRLTDVDVAYRWTGDAGDGDWNNTLNWEDALVPVDTAPGGGNNSGMNLPYYHYITFDGTNLPSVNVPGLGGSYPEVEKCSPSMVFKRGGSITLNVLSQDSGFWTYTSTTRTVLEVGDGIGGGDEDVEVTITGLTGQLNRHASGSTHNFLVKSDGSLIFNNNVDFTYSNGTDRFSTMTIEGGSIIVNGYVTDLARLSQNKVEFTALDGTFTAQFGGEFPDLAAVKNSLDVDFINSSGVEDMRLIAVYTGVNSFTVKVAPIPPDGTLIMVQ